MHSFFCFLAIPPPDPFKSSRAKTPNVQKINYQEPAQPTNIMNTPPLQITFQNKIATQQAGAAVNTLEKVVPPAPVNNKAGNTAPWNTPVTIQNNLNPWAGSINAAPTTTVPPPTVTQMPQIATTGTTITWSLQYITVNGLFWIYHI